MNPWTPKEYEEKIVEQEPDFYWDSEYENYQAVFEEVVFPFSLELHDDRPGLLAKAESALPPQDGYREENDRFTLLKRGSGSSARRPRDKVSLEATADIERESVGGDGS
ncbi:hypothetical protein [Natrinema sp. H-ect4]|uniref:hypothetical protein n=1 Tax=Natrinema sp. H-ect4 TaxID=3242699 RepID=UPI0035A8D803